MSAVSVCEGVSAAGIDVVFCCGAGRDETISVGDLSERVQPTVRRKIVIKTRGAGDLLMVNSSCSASLVNRAGWSPAGESSCLANLSG